MLDKPYFYHSCIKNIVTVFGAMFNNVVIKRSIEGADYQQIAVPLTYAPKDRMLLRINQNPQIDDRKVEVVLPRMSFEMTSMEYDTARKISNASKTTVYDVPSTPGGNSVSRTMNAPVPYNLHFNLYIYTKNQDDGLQIVEQILPFFTPELSITVNTVPEMNRKDDIAFCLDGVSYEDDYEGAIETRRAIIWTLSFTAKMNFFGPVQESSLIKHVNVTMNTNTTGSMGANVNASGLSSQASVKYTLDVVPESATPSSQFDIVEQFLYG